MGWSPYLHCPLGLKPGFLMGVGDANKSLFSTQSKWEVGHVPDDLEQGQGPRTLLA